MIAASRGTGGIAGGVTAPYPVNGDTPFASLAAGRLAHHHAQAGITAATSAALLVSPKFLLWLVVKAIVGAATALHGDAFVSAQHIAFVALAGFDTGLRASGGSRPVGAAGRAGIATGLVVTVLWAR